LPIVKSQVSTTQFPVPQDLSSKDPSSEAQLTSLRMLPDDPNGSQFPPSSLVIQNSVKIGIRWNSVWRCGVCTVHKRDLQARHGIGRLVGRFVVRKPNQGVAKHPVAFAPIGLTRPLNLNHGGHFRVHDLYNELNRLPEMNDDGHFRVQDLYHELNRLPEMNDDIVLSKPKEA
jgi:hypothetical protein